MLYIEVICVQKKTLMVTFQIPIKIQLLLHTPWGWHQKIHKRTMTHQSSKNANPLKENNS
jgi:hypothetical protein